jgi:hypothetical protein
LELVAGEWQEVDRVDRVVHLRRSTG